MEHMERQLANLTGLVQKALIHNPTMGPGQNYLGVPGSGGGSGGSTAGSMRSGKRIGSANFINALSLFTIALSSQFSLFYSVFNLKFH